MGQIGGFKIHQRTNEQRLPAKQRILNYDEYTIPLPEDTQRKQASRCMDCGVPFCHSACPLGNLIPDFNHNVHLENYREALEILHSTNNFPEFTGRLCPAPCEKACVLGIIKEPVAIENIEKSLVEKGFSKGWITPQIPNFRTGKKIAIVGSGPAGLAAAQQLNRLGHWVTVFERADALGGLLRYGIPNFKLEKHLIDRRIDQLKAEGIQFQTNAEVGKNIPVSHLESYNATLLCGGASTPRNLPIMTRKVKGVHQAMEYLTFQTKSLFQSLAPKPELDAKNKTVIVIGGGDTGSDCIGTANRQGAHKVINFEILPKPPKFRSTTTPWPFWPLQLKTTSSHEEGCERNWLISTKEFITDKNGNLTALKTVEVSWEVTDGTHRLKEKPNSEKIWPCDMVLLALGFTGPENSLAKQLGIHLNSNSTYSDTQYQTNVESIFTAGDMRRGQSLIVWAIAEGRNAADAVNRYLNKKTLRESSIKNEDHLLRA